MKDAGRSASGCKPNIIIAKDSDARAARGERSLTRQCGGHVLARNLLPRCAAIVCANDKEPIIHWIAKRDSMTCIPERKAIEKRLRLTIHESECPGLPAVSCFIDSRFFCFTSAEEIRRLRIHS